MKEGKTDYQCEVCRVDFTQPFPMAENRDEYNAARAKLAGGYWVDDHGQAQRRIKCPNPKCGNKVRVTILDRED